MSTDLARHGLKRCPNSKWQNHSHLCQGCGGVAASPNYFQVYTLLTWPETLRIIKAPLPASSTEWTPVALDPQQRESLCRPTPATHWLFSELHWVPKSADNEERHHCSALGAQASTGQRVTAKQLREGKLDLQNGFITPAFKEGRQNSFDDGKKKQKAIYRW